MNETAKLCRVRKLLFISPYLFLLFLVVPVYFVLSLKLHIPHITGDLLLGNNVLLCLVLALRVIWRVLRMRGTIRYDADASGSGRVLELEQPAGELRSELAGAGFNFNAAGNYGERRDLGYLGGTVLYGGLLLLLFFGSYDYTREYSVMGRLGVGDPMPLDGTQLVGEIEAGIFARTTELPLVQVKQQILPNQQWPQGATAIALLSRDRKELATATIAPGKHFSYGGLDYFMTRFIFDGLIVIRDGNAIAYENFVKFFPLPVKKGEYGYYGGLVNMNSGIIRGDAWLNPADKKKVHVEAMLGKKKIIDTDLELWGENLKTQGPFAVKLDGLAQWSEIRVARGRHRALLILGALLAAIGGLLRASIRPQRVWLEELEGGCRVRAVGGTALQLLANSEKQ